MKRSKIITTLIALALLLTMLLPTSAVSAYSSEYNVALNKPVYLNGIFFTGGWGGGISVSELTITDGIFLPRGHQWDQGAVWWDSDSNPPGQSITINLEGLFEISSLVVQADDNDAYNLYYHNPLTDSWQLVWSIPNYDEVPDASSWGMQTRPNPLDDTERYILPSPIITDSLKLVGNDADSDLDYAISEIQAYGYAIKNYVTGGGTYDQPGVGKKTDWNLAGNVGTNEVEEIVGQFNIVNHMTKTTYHSTGFTYITFFGDIATTPTAIDQGIIFTGSFRNDRDDSIITLTVSIWENVFKGEGKKGLDAIAIQEGEFGAGGDMWIGDQGPGYIVLKAVTSGNFQRHNIEN